MVKVLHITFMYPAPHRPNHGVAIEEWIETLADARPDINNQILKTTYGLQGEPYTWKGRAVDILRISSFIKLIQQVPRLPEFSKPDFIHYHNLFPGILLQKSAWLKSIPYNVSLRASCLHTVRWLRQKQAVRHFLANANCITSPAPNHAKSIFRHLKIDPPNFFAVPNWKADTWAMGATSPTNSPIKSILIPAHSEPRKRIPQTISSMLRADPTLSITVAGSGELDWMSKLNSENVRHMGHLSPSDLKAAIDKHDCTAVLAKVETFGLVYAEAVLRNRPVLYGSQSGFASFDTQRQFGVPIADLKNINEIKRALTQLPNIAQNITNADKAIFLRSYWASKIGEFYPA